MSIDVRPAGGPTDWHALAEEQSPAKTRPADSPATRPDGTQGSDEANPNRDASAPSLPGLEPSTETVIPGAWSQLDQWMATAGLQGTAAVDAPEMAAQAGQEEPNPQDVSLAARAAQSAGLQRASLGEDGTGPGLMNNDAKGDNLGSRSSVTAADLTLPTAAVTAQAAAFTQDTVAAQPLQQGVLTSLVSGQPQPTWPRGDSPDERVNRRRSSREREQRQQTSDDDGLLNDDLPEQQARRDDEANPCTDDKTLVADWCAALAKRLARIQQRRSSASHPAKPSPGNEALSLALAQWMRKRAVLIVCPQREARDDKGWAFLLWGQPSQQHAPTQAGQEFGLAGAKPNVFPELSGDRFVARLHWKFEHPDPAQASVHWWAVRAAKQHGVALGRQLRILAERAGDADAYARDDASASSHLRTSDLGIQLGPVLLPHARDLALRVRIDAVQRLWSALDGQWSLLVLACSDPLLD